jgi:hypothetical protein
MESQHIELARQAVALLRDALTGDDRPRLNVGSTSTRITSGDDQSSFQHPVCTPHRKT